MSDYATARLNMVEGQVKPNRVFDRALLTAMLNVPRELFVPKAARGIAYIDRDIAIGKSRYLLKPMVLARLIETAEIAPDDVVLDVGCGSGYACAVMARLANTVVGVENDPDLVRQATTLLSQLGVDNAAVMEGPLTEGWPAQAPYQCILINGAVAEVPRNLTDQLADGGRLVTIISPHGHMGKAVLVKRTGNVISRREIFDAASQVLPGFEPRPVFEF